MTIEVRRDAGSGFDYIDGTNGQVSVEQVRGVVGKLGREIANWMSDVQGRGRMGAPNLINRQSYASPSSPYSIMNTAYMAVDNDDIVGGVADVTEGLMFQGQQFESDDANESDIFNQIARDLNLDQFARQWHREEFTYSQVVMGIWWGRRNYVARNKTAMGKKSKKNYNVRTPVALTFLDPRKVVPLQPGPFGQDRLAWQATKDEFAAYLVSWQTGAYADALTQEFMNGPLVITNPAERKYLADIGVRPDWLISLNPSSVVRYCRTKAHYERFTNNRLKSVFPLLDLKQQLMEADRVTLVGAANFILLVRQGSKEEPATQGEIDNLQENFKVVAKVPVVVGDHRLSIDIITPNQDNTLNTGKYDTLDRRILARSLGALTVASSGQRNESSLTIARGIGRLLESRRKMYQRFLEETVVRAIVDHPDNSGLFKSEPNLAFTPRNIQLDSDAEFTKAVLAMRTQNELSRSSLLEYFGFDQAVEAMRRDIEAEPGGFDDTFQTRIPFNSPDNNGGQPGAEVPPVASQVSGAQGGRPKGGGDPPQSVNGM